MSAIRADEARIASQREEIETGEQQRGDAPIGSPPITRRGTSYGQANQRMPKKTRMTAGSAALSASSTDHALSKPARMIAPVIRPRRQPASHENIPCAEYH